MHRVATRMGMSLREYEHTVPPANRHFHEKAETLLLAKEGLLPLKDDDGEIDADVELDNADSSTKTIRN